MNDGNLSLNFLLLNYEDRQNKNRFTNYLSLINIKNDENDVQFK